MGHFLQKHWYYLFFAVIALGVHQTFFHGGYFGFDELTYSALADDLFKGDLDKSLNLFAHRYSILIPLALSYTLFGVNDFANMIPSFLSIIVILAISLYFLREFPVAIKWICTVYIICFPMHLMYLSKPMPDLIVELGFLLCFLALYHTRFSSGQKNYPLWTLFIIGGLMIFFAKETFLIIYPFFIFYFFKDLHKGKFKSFWIKSSGTLILLALGYFAFSYLYFGSPFIRVEAIFHERFISECSYEFQPLDVLIKRISYELWLDFIKSGVLIPLGFLVLLRKKHQLASSQNFILRSFLFLLLLSNFMTISYTAYVPLCNDVRHFLFVFPLGVFTLGIGLLHLKKLNWTEVILVSLSIFIQGLIVEWWYPETYLVIYSLIAFGVILFKLEKLKILAIIAITLGLGFQYYYNATYNLKTNHPAQKELLYFVLNKPGKKIVITDSANTRLGRMYAQYDTSMVEFVRYHEFEKSLDIENIPTYIILNGMTAWFSRVNWDLVPEKFKEDSDQLSLLMENEIGKVFLYVVGEFEVEIED